MNTPPRLRLMLLSGAYITALAGCTGQQDAPAADSSQATETPVTQAAAVEPVATPPVAADAGNSGAVSEAAIKYDSQIVHQTEAGRGKDDGWFLVKEGKRRWITDDKWPAANGYDPQKVIYITTEEFYAIPEDLRPLPNPDDVSAK